MINILITCPSGETGFVENKRGFCVEGIIKSDNVLSDNISLHINLYDDKDNLVRQVYSDHKNKDIYVDYDGFTLYKEELDPNKIKLKEFGFAPLVVDDISNPDVSIHNGYIKAWFNDTSFKAVIMNGTLNDGLNLKDIDGNDYSNLAMGIYKLEVILKQDNAILASTVKNIEIGKRQYQLIGRFNPVSHKNRLIDWCKENNVSIITDLIPGYLQPYLGKWFYHMGLLKMYRANDLCLFDDTNVKLFNYLIDSTSTSYETELAYLQARSKLNSKFEVYYYDIGEANIEDKKANVLKFTDSEYGHICRVDVLNNTDCENKYYLDRRYVDKSLYGQTVYVDKNCNIAIMGIIKPVQLDSNDFILKDDNTYIINDYVDTIRYNVNGFIINRKANMERIDDESIGYGLYEFYNVFNVKEDLNIHVDCIYKKGRITSVGDLYIKVK